MCKKMKAVKDEVRAGQCDERIRQKDPYTFARLTSKVGKGFYYGIGFSKRNPIDEPDDALGKEIAVGRAVHDIACQVRDSRDGSKPKREVMGYMVYDMRDEEE